MHAYLVAQHGLSTMGRNHIHLAQGVSGSDIISGASFIQTPAYLTSHVPLGMRRSSQVLIFINLEKALAAGIKFYLSSNGVVLTPGNELGFLDPKFFSRVERVNMQQTLLFGEAPPGISESISALETQLDATSESTLQTSEGKTIPSDSPLSACPWSTP